MSLATTPTTATWHAWFARLVRFFTESTATRDEMRDW